MEIRKSGSQPSAKGPKDWFTWTVRIDPLFDRTKPARVSGASVTFEPGARTAWHTHPPGQTLLVKAGFGLVQTEVNLCNKSGPVTSSGLPLGKNTGTVRALRFRKSMRGRWLIAE